MQRALTIETSPLTQLFKALGDDVRLRIVALLSHGELCVCHLQAALQISQPHASRSLALLKSAGVVAARRDGNWIHYRLADQPDLERRRLLRVLVREFAGRATLHADVARLTTVQGPGSCR